MDGRSAPPIHALAVCSDSNIGERGRLAYSTAELDGLYATAHKLAPVGLCTLKPPPGHRIHSWPQLRATLVKLKNKLTKMHRRAGLPAATLVTEFDLAPELGPEQTTAGFHIAFAAEPATKNISELCSWWLKEMQLPNNYSHSFHYDQQEGGRKLADYLSKDVIKKSWPWRWVKYPVSWLPQRLECSLWFAVGCRRQTARTGRAMRMEKRRIRKRYKAPSSLPSGITHASDTEPVTVLDRENSEQCVTSNAPAWECGSKPSQSCHTSLSAHTLSPLNRARSHFSKSGKAPMVTAAATRDSGSARARKLNGSRSGMSEYSSAYASHLYCFPTYTSARKTETTRMNGSS